MEAHHIHLFVIIWIDHKFPAGLRFDRRCADDGGDGSNEMVDSANMWQQNLNKLQGALASDTAEATR